MTLTPTLYIYRTYEACLLLYGYTRRTIYDTNTITHLPINLHHYILLIHFHI